MNFFERHCKQSITIPTWAMFFFREGDRVISTNNFKSPMETLEKFYSHCTDKTISAVRGSVLSSFLDSQRNFALLSSVEARKEYVLLESRPEVV